MGRRRAAKHRAVVADAIYGSEALSKFISRIMESGKRNVAESIVYGALQNAEKKSGTKGVDIFTKAIDNVKPLLEVKSRRVGGATYQVPVEVNPNRQIALSMRWIIASARSRNGRTMAEKLMNELLDASNGTGGAMKKREEMHKMAEGNKAFAHYRW
ncbi:MAG: 30S ribosomal protein S7 [Spirochaetes bacterium]|nr:30S ribosomal protein S7 [Spirochaetota bacterium]